MLEISLRIVVARIPSADSRWLSAVGRVVDRLATVG